MFFQTSISCWTTFSRLSTFPCPKKTWLHWTACTEIWGSSTSKTSPRPWRVTSRTATKWRTSPTSFRLIWTLSKLKRRRRLFLDHIGPSIVSILVIQGIFHRLLLRRGGITLWKTINRGQRNVRDQGLLKKTEHQLKGKASYYWPPLQLIAFCKNSLHRTAELNQIDRTLRSPSVLLIHIEI